jgi:LL-diaminopimelate aminotransferase
MTEKISAKYKRRLEMMVEVLKSVGFSAKMPNGSFYLYVGAPKGIQNGVRFKAAEDVSEYFITEKLISTVPWDDVGHYLRFSATFVAKNEEDERRVIGEMKKRMGELDLEF